MSFTSNTPSLWDQRPAQDAVDMFTKLAVASPHGVEGLASGALSPPPRSDEAADRISELARYFFKEIVKKSMTYSEHDRWMDYRTKHLVLALEQFAEEVKQQQMLPEYLDLEETESGESKDDGEEEMEEWKEEVDDEEDEAEAEADEEAIREIYEKEQEEREEILFLPDDEQDEANDNIMGYHVDIRSVATPKFDELFPPVAEPSARCLSDDILAKTWNDTGNRFYRSDLHVYADDRDAFYGKLNDSLNAYIATMLLEPRSLDSAFAKVDD